MVLDVNLQSLQMLLPPEQSEESFGIVVMRGTYDLCMYIIVYIYGGFLKWRIPKTIGFNTKSV